MQRATRREWTTYLNGQMRRGRPSIRRGKCRRAVKSSHNETVPRPQSRRCVARRFNLRFGRVNDLSSPIDHLSCVAVRNDDQHSSNLGFHKSPPSTDYRSFGAHNLLIELAGFVMRMKRIERSKHADRACAIGAQLHQHTINQTGSVTHSRGLRIHKLW